MTWKTFHAGEITGAKIGKQKSTKHIKKVNGLGVWVVSNWIVGDKPPKIGWRQVV